MEFLAQLHPKIVHFPVAFLSIYVLLEITGVLSKREFFRKTAYLFLFLGVISAVAAAITGNQASELASRWEDKGAIIPFGLISRHEEYANITMWYFAALLVFRTYLVIRKKFKAVIQYVFIVLAIVGGYLIYETGDLGGKLVYDHGVGTELKREEIK